MNSPQLDTSTLEALRDSLNRLQASAEDDGGQLEALVDTSELPTFGGSPPEDTCGVFSWDPDRFLIYSTGWQLVDRVMLS